MNHDIAADQPPKKPFWLFVEGPLFLTWYATIATIVSMRIFSADHHVIVLCRILGLAAWAFFAAGVYRAQLFHDFRFASPGRVTLMLIIAAAMWFGWHFGPWQHAPKIAVKAFSPFYVKDGKGWLNAELQNESDDDAFNINWDAKLKLVPFDSNGADVESYIAMDDRLAKEIFDALDKREVLRKELMHSSVNPWHTLLISARTDEAIREKDSMADHEAGRLTAFVGGRITYRDSNGCKYQSEFCGFISKSSSAVANCRGGHFSQGVRLQEPCNAE